MIHVPKLNDIKDLEEKSIDSSKKILLLGSQTDILGNLKSFFKKIRPRLIFLDFSMYFQSGKFKLREEFKEQKCIELRHVTDEFWRKSENVINCCRLVLDEKGFIAIKVNGTIKSSLKSKLDIIFGSDHFVNEIIIDSPYKVWYAPNSTVFERTNYILIYSQNLNPRINPVLNEKESGGYWHSFVSKGQGSPKKFVFKDKGELILAPPPGTHWKLKQETILDLCSKGQIRLNKKGNPEYWVPRRKGQIIDSNWLDIQSFEWIFSHITNSFGFYKRLLEMCLKEHEFFLDLSVNLGVSLIVANQLNLECIGLEEEKCAFRLMTRLITNQGIIFSAFNCESLSLLPITNYSQSYDAIGINDSFSTNKLAIKLKIIERYRGQQQSFEEEKSNEWTNMLVLGDSFDVLPCLKDKLQKKLKLIYIDPPFFTGTNEIIVIPIGLPEKDGFQLDTYFDYPVEDLAYNNILNNPNPIKFFMQWFKKRVLLMKSLLRDDGHIFVRFDYHYGHYARKVLDEVFGLHNFVNEFLVRRMKKNLSLKQAYNQTHLIVHSDSIFVYQSSKKARLNPIAIKKRKRKSQDLIERQYSNDNLWIDVAGYEKVKKTLYPTENSETLLSRIIKMSTEKGDLIADFFAGSGTTLAVAEKLKRNWVGVDIGHYSIHEIKKRLLRIPNYNPFNILSSQHLDQTSSPVARFDIDVDNKKLKVTIVDFVLDKPLPRRRTQNYIDYIDYWAIDWDYQNALFEPKWYSCREMRGKKVLSNIQSSITYEYSNPGKYLVTIAIYDVFGKSIRQSFPINIK